MVTLNEHLNRKPWGISMATSERELESKTWVCPGCNRTFTVAVDESAPDVCADCFERPQPEQPSPFLISPAVRLELNFHRLRLWLKLSYIVGVPFISLASLGLATILTDFRPSVQEILVTYAVVVTITGILFAPVLIGLLFLVDVIGMRMGFYKNSTDDD